MKPGTLLSTCLLLLLSCNNENTEELIPPIANFSAAISLVEENTTIQFTNTSQFEETYSWSFEGGIPSTSTQQNPEVLYNIPGSYSVTLNVSNEDGSDSETKNDYINVTRIPVPPIAAFSASNTSIEENDAIEFTSTSSNASLFQWEFPGGIPMTSTLENPTITYANEGSYAVTLMVSNDDGSDFETKNDYINVSMPSVVTTTYTVVFKGNWSVVNHPESFPTGDDHFSSAVGMVHNSNTSIFQNETLASIGIENMAELGDNSALSEEIDAIIAAGNAHSYFDGGDLGSGTSEVSFQITVTEEFPLVSIVSMIAPSPDWFIAARNIELFKDDSFINQVTVNAASYDSGTDNGVSFLSVNEDKNPVENIHLISTPPLAITGIVDPPMATFTFTKN